MIIYLEMINAPEERHKFEVLYRAYRRMMFYIANRILNNELDAEDAVHSAFVYIAENIQKIDEPMCPKTRGYIVTIVEGRAIDMYRRKQRHPKYQLDEETAGMTVTYDDANVITRCISLLPMQDRQILMLKYRYGYTNSEIAGMLDLSEAAAIKRIQRAKEKLEQLCAEEGLL